MAILSPGSIIKRIRALWKSGTLCDITLTCHGDIQMQCHRIILAANSDFFHQKGIQESDFYFPDISAHYMTQVLNYMYGEKLSVTDENFKDIKNIATVFAIIPLIQVCDRYAKHSLSIQKQIETFKNKNYPTRSSHEIGFTNDNQIVIYESNKATQPDSLNKIDVEIYRDKKRGIRRSARHVIITSKDCLKNENMKSTATDVISRPIRVQKQERSQKVKASDQIKQSTGKCTSLSTSLRILHPKSILINKQQVKMRKNCIILKKFKCSCCKFRCEYLSLLIMHKRTKHRLCPNHYVIDRPSMIKLRQAVQFLRRHKHYCNKITYQKAKHRNQPNTEISQRSRKKLGNKRCYRNYSGKSRQSDLYCDICGELFKSAKRLKVHRGEAHPEKQLKNNSPKSSSHLCDICLLRLHGHSKLMMHRVMEHSVGLQFSVQTACTETNCETVYIFKEEYAYHYKTMHKLPIQYCPKEGCNQIFMTKDSDTVGCHLMVEHAEPLLQCNIDTCEFGSVFWLTLYKHMRMHHKQIRCLLCPEISQQLIPALHHLLKNHNIAVESHIKRCRGDGCRYASYCASTLLAHVSSVHDDLTPATCNMCHLVCKNQRNLVQHIKKNHEQEKRLCGRCGKQFVSRFYMNQHEKTCGTRDKLLHCSMCDFTTNTPSSIDNHMFCRHGVQKNYAKVHVCEVCGYQTIRKNALRIHLKMHNGVKDHICNVCGKAFTVQSTLKSHMQSHSDQRPYHCPRCDYSSRLQSTLQQHIIVVHLLEGRKPFKCPYCPHRTAMKMNCRKHVKQQHPDQPPEVLQLEPVPRKCDVVLSLSN